ILAQDLTSIYLQDKQQNYGRNAVILAPSETQRMNYTQENLLNQLMLSDLSDDGNGELISIITSELDDSEGAEKNNPDTLPLLPVRNTVLFPGVVIPITVSRKKSVRL